MSRVRLRQCCSAVCPWIPPTATRCVFLLQEYLKTHSDDDAAGLLLAKALRNSGRGDEALRAVDGVLARKHENIIAVVLKGSLLLDQRKPQEAAALYQKLAASSEARSRAEGKALGGRVALLMGHFHDGLRDLRGAVDQARQAKIPSLQGQYLMTLAQAQATLGRNQEALGTYAEVRNVEAGLDPNLMIINVMVSQKQYDTARSMLEDQIAHWKGKASVDFLEKLRSSLEGSIALEEGNYKDAVARLEAALPDRASASVKSESLGRALLETGNPGKAEAIFRRITEDPDRYTDPIGYVRGLARLGEACEKQGKKDEALRAYREVLSWWGAADYSLPEIEKTKEALKRLGG
ncbi:MAG: hypothetical protein DMH00_08955 [Acidobacteria bacterium]|nr:MAG: hypothetical protein DMH00_08955 [Acidobacteriota bacterium]